MGYDSSMKVDVEVKADKVKECRLAIKDALASEKMTYFDDILITNEGYIEFNDYYGKHYDEEELAQVLAPYVEEGWIYFRGEDEEAWAIEFNGKGAWRIRDGETCWKKAKWMTIDDVILNKI